MWCRSACKRSIALHVHHTPFVEGALQLHKIHLAHRQASEDLHFAMKGGESNQVEGRKTLCRTLEREFIREVEGFRPVFTMTAGLEVASQYSHHIFHAMRYFGCEDDPLVRQLSAIVGRAALKRDARARVEHGTPGKKEMNGFGLRPGRGPIDEEPIGTTLPSELPHPPQIKPEEQYRRRPGALRLPVAHRGHWVLQEPEIAITREERKEDPW